MADAGLGRRAGRLTGRDRGFRSWSTTPGIAGPVAPLTAIEPRRLGRGVRGQRPRHLPDVPGVPARHGRPRCGDVINLASVSGKRPLPRRTPYCASKMAVIGLTSTLAFEVGPLGVNVNCLSPGPVEGERMSRNFRLEAERTGTTYAEAEQAFVSRAALGRMVTETEVGAAVVAMLAMPGPVRRRHRPVRRHGGLTCPLGEGPGLGRRTAARRAAADARRGAARDVRGDRLRLRAARRRARATGSRAAPQLTWCWPSGTACGYWSGSGPANRPPCCGCSTWAPTAWSARTSTRRRRPARSSTPRTTRRSGTGGSPPTAAAGRFGQVPARRPPGRAAAEHLGHRHGRVAGGCGLVADILAVPGLDGVMVGPADLRIASGPDDLDPAVAIDRVHEAVTAAGKVRMDIVTGTAPAVRSPRARSAAGGLQPHPHA